MPKAVRFVGGPLDGQTYFMPRTPSRLYAQRTVEADGVVFAPTPHEAAPPLHAGVYRRVEDPWSDAPLYRFEEPA